MVKTRTHAITTIALTLSACTITIDQNKLYKTDMAQPREGELSAPKGYVLDDRIVELPGLGNLHVARLDNPKTEAVIIFNGGRGNFVALQTVRMRRLAKATGMDIILYDYTGRGGTDIPLSTDNSLATGPALIDYAKKAGWIKNAKLYAYGFSFGGSQASAMIRKGGFDGLIIEGSAPDVKGIGEDYLPGVVRPFVKLKVDEEMQRFQYYDYVRDAKIPVLLLSNTEDEVVRTEHMQAFYDDLKRDGAKVSFIKTPGGHGDSLEQPDAQTAIQTFVSQSKPAATTATSM
ncbi:MAG: prolyl oligopeptidase family serine peptidase [Sphingobium sp.]|nr:prolyl oligopeptidase family serine peptidase [Sphingobium sp.]MCP5397740.1 prolyl oligopeptidase family serine peptidase [Sphingomonas sp.]